MSRESNVLFPVRINVILLDHVHLRHLSDEYQSILSVDVSTKCGSIYRLTLDWHIDQVCRHVDWHRSPLDWHACLTILCRHLADTLLTLLIRHYCHLVAPVIGLQLLFSNINLFSLALRDFSFASPIGKETLPFQQNSGEQRTYTTDNLSIHHRHSTDTLPTIQRNGRGVGRVSIDKPTKYWSIVVVGCLPTWITWRLTVDWHVDGITIDSRSTCRPIVSVNTRPTDALGTHNPSTLHSISHVRGHRRASGMSKYQKNIKYLI